MLTGIELAGLVLAIFPLVISGLEHYEEGMQPVKEWIRFRAEFLSFMNALGRQKIFFRQNIEDLLSSVVSSEYEMACMLDNPQSHRWQDANLEAKLKLRLSGRYEYEAFMNTATAIRDTLNKLAERLKITPGDEPWYTQKSSIGSLKLEYGFRRLTYVLSKKRRTKLMESLEKKNDDIQKLLGNSDRLEPMRRKRKSNIPSFFQQIRNQATGLHTALMQAWKCDCTTTHSTKLLLAKKAQEGISPQPDSTIRLELLLPRLPQMPTKDISGPLAKEGWFATEVRMMESSEGATPRRPSPYRLDSSSMYSVTTDSRSRKISFQSDNSLFPGAALTPATTITESGTEHGEEIHDLCAAVNDTSQIRHYLGHLRDGKNRHYSLHLALNFPFSSAQIQRVLSLDALLGANISSDDDAPAPALSRRTRLSIAVTLAHSLLQLHSGPWLNDTWGKKDVYFFQGEDGRIYTEQPFVLADFQSWKQVKEYKPANERSPSETRTARQASTSALLSLGIVILELWFNQKLELRPYRAQFLGPNGEKNEYTDFNTAQKWQETALEEAGLDLHNATRRCIFCAFGAASQDLQDEELQRAVYDEVIVPLERILAQFESQTTW